MLCGGSYLDLLGRAYGVSSLQSVYIFFHEFIDSIETSFELPLIDLLLRLEKCDKKALATLKKIKHRILGRLQSSIRTMYRCNRWLGCENHESC